MRVTCHTCETSWEFPDASRLARCSACAVLALPPAGRGSAALTVEPPDGEVLCVRPDADEGALRAAWARFLSKVPSDRYPEARWNVGKLDELQTALQRGLAEGDLDPHGRARLSLLAGHGHASAGSFEKARSQWVVATGLKRQTTSCLRTSSRIIRRRRSSMRRGKDAS